MVRISTFKIGLLTAAGLAIFSCGKKEEKKENSRVVYDAASAAIEIPVQTSINGVGAIQGLVSAASVNTQVISAAEDSRLKGTVVAFPPTSFDIDQDVELEEARTLASRANLAKLVNAETRAEASGPTVSVFWTYDEDTFIPYRIKLPAPAKPVDPTETAGATPNQAGKSLVVLFIKNEAVTDDFKLGLLPSSELTVSDGFVTFTSSSYGIYQAVWINAVPKEVAVVKADSAGGKIGKIEGQAPLAFNLVPMTSTLYAKSVLVQWDPSDLADTYELILSTKDATCADPYATTPGIKSLRKVIEMGVDGANYVCITAKNAYGEIRAGNNGIKINVDRSAPGVPSKPIGIGATKVSVKFTWNTVVDAGGSGLSHYFVRIGTTPGGADKFNADVVDVVSKEILGAKGETYYAQVKAVDIIGNESDWSPVSEGVTVLP